MWSFPKEVVNAVRWHHDPEASDYQSMQIDVVHLSNLLCQTDTTGDDSGQLVELSTAVIDRLGIEISQFESISEKVAQWVDELSDALTFN
jgi:HD-like signal output (HDOD) protein